MRKGLFAAVLLLATPLIAQERATVNVNLIEVPVTVVSRDGEPVRKLTAANFQLFDDGKPQTIASFDTIDFASNAPVTAISPMNPAARRAFMLLFDLGYSSPTTLARAQEAARKFVAQSVKPRDLVAVATIDPEHFRLLSAFTTDRELIAAAIARPNNFRSNDPLQLTNLTRTFEPADDAGITPLDSAGQTSRRRATS